MDIKIDATINALFGPLADGLSSIVFYSAMLGEHKIMLILVWLVLASLFFTLYFGFINFRYFKHAIDLVRGKDLKKGEATDGQITRFQALATSLSGTVGLGNIAGVAVAISVGGPGAAFWMMIMGFLGMSTKFAEVMLGVKYRIHPDPDDPEKISGGPMYYIEHVFNRWNIPYLGRIMGSFFAVCCAVGVIGGASLFQTNQVFQQALAISGGEESILFGKGWLVGLGMVVLVGLVIIGGIKSIAAVAGRLVPSMAGIYILASIVVLGIHIDALPAALLTIIHSALTPEAGMGAVIGAILTGVQRASFSNEAGLGTASIAHAAAKTNQPVTQGFVGMLGPFIDTVIICMMTALVIIVTGAYTGSVGMEGVELTSRAFASGVSWFPYLLFVVVFLFAFSSLISWAYYGVKAFTYLFGNNKFMELLYKIIFCAFIIVGGASDLSSVILFTDSAVFLMAIPNIIALYLFAPEIKRDIKAYITGLKS